MLRAVLDTLGNYFDRVIASRSSQTNSPQAPGFDSAFAMFGCQRTGTHLLRELLNTNPAIAVLAEVFSRYPQRVYWQNFIRTLPKHRYPPQLPEDAATLVDDYIQVIRRDVQRNGHWYGGRKPQLKTIGLDIKYNQLRFVAPVYSDLIGRPFLLDYLSKRGIGVVHVVRRNLMRTAISVIVANLRNVWQNYDGSKIQGKYRIPTEDLLNYMRWIKAEREEFCRLTQDLSVCACHYEDLVEDLRQVGVTGAFPEDTKVLRPLAAFLNVPNQFSYIGNIHKAINKPYAEVIENYDEVLGAVEMSELSEFAKAA